MSLEVQCGVMRITYVESNGCTTAIATIFYDYPTGQKDIYPNIFLNRDNFAIDNVEFFHKDDSYVSFDSRDWEDDLESLLDRALLIAELYHFWGDRNVRG